MVAPADGHHPDNPGTIHATVEAGRNLTFKLSYIYTRFQKHVSDFTLFSGWDVGGLRPPTSLRRLGGAFGPSKPPQQNCKADKNLV